MTNELLRSRVPFSEVLHHILQVHVGSAVCVPV